MKKRNRGLSTLLACCILLTLLPATAFAYSERTSAPASNNSYYYSSANPFYEDGWAGQCTWYAYGRAYEILGSKPKLSTGNADTWYSYNQTRGYYAYGATAKVGAIACWYKSGACHVAVVERIDNGTVYISEFNRNSDRTFHFQKAVVDGRGPDGYIYLTESGNGGVVSGSVTTSTAEEITETSAVLYGSATGTGGKVTEVGMYLGASAGSMTKLGSDAVDTYTSDMWYSTAKYGRTLTPGTTYYYQAYAVVGGKTYWGTVKSFTTSGSSEVVVSGEYLKLSYDANGGSNGPGYQSVSSSQPVTSHTYTIQATVPVRAGYTFLGWSLSASATAASYSPGDSITITAPTTLYAVWKGNTQALAITNTGAYDIPATVLGQPIPSVNVSGAVSGGVPPYTFQASGLPAGVYLSRAGVISGTPTALTAAHTVTVTVIDSAGASASMKIAMGAITAGTTVAASDLINYASETIAVKTGMQWTSDTQDTNSYFTAFWDEDLPVGEKGAASYGLYFGNTLFFREEEGGAWTRVVIPARPAAPGGVSGGKGSLTGVRSSMEYSRDGASWTPCSGSTVSGLAAGTYQVRYKATKTAFASKAVTVQVTGNTATGFVDVSSGAYYSGAVQWAVAQGITSGTSATTFSPEDACTRAQAVTFLWRAAGSPAPAGKTNPFADVRTGDYYYDAVLWAVEKGITAGTSASLFSPNDTCTRGQIVTFLYRAAGSPAVSGGSGAFSDVAPSQYYHTAVTWAVKQGITSGTSGTTFSPEEACIRAQIVTFLYRAAG